MEKQRKKRYFKLIPGLLKAAFVCAGLFAAAPGFSQQRLTYNIIKELTVKPVNKTNFSATDCAFELKIPYIKSDLVQAQIPDLPAGVNFVSLRRSEYSDEGKESGTKIELWLSFADAKTYRLRSLHVYINSRLYYLPFEPVVISENPRNILPQLVVTFDNGAELISQRRGRQQSKSSFTTVAGKPIQFTVQLQYAVQIISYNWSVPKNALVRELEQFDITKGTLRSSEFSEERIPVATFEWEPLYAGDLTLPELHIIATSYNGTRVELMLPETPITVVEENYQRKPVENAEYYFGYAFTKKQVKTHQAQKVEVTEADCQKIADLRNKERHSIPYTGSYAERKAFEEEKGIMQGATEPTHFVLWLSVVLIFLFVGLDLISGFKRKLGGILVCSGFVVIFIVVMTISIVQLGRTLAVFKGGNIRSVPEETASSVVSIESGKRVLVEQHAGDWLFVRFASNGGWVKKDSVIFIGK